MEIPEEPVTFLGSFWRETAVTRDELHWYATGHKLVEALLGLVRDGDAGRAAIVKVALAPRRGALLVRFHPALPAPADLAAGARVPSRQAQRYVDLSPVSVAVDLESGRLVPGLAARVEEEDDLVDARVTPPPANVLQAAFAAAEREASAVLERRRADALARLAAHAEREEERLVTAAFEGGAARDVVEAALVQVRRHQLATEDAIRKIRLDTDAAALLVP
jgi:ATP-dependent helicase HepA